jgi:hypothetical protein
MGENIAKLTLWDEQTGDADSIERGTLHDADGSRQEIKLTRHAITKSDLPYDLDGFCVVASLADGEGGYDRHVHGEVRETAGGMGSLKLTVDTFGFGLQLP